MGLQLSVWTAGRYLTHWNLTPQKPRELAFERDPVDAHRWLAQKYPAIHEAAKAAG